MPQLRSPNALAVDFIAESNHKSRSKSHCSIGQIAKKCEMPHTKNGHFVKKTDRSTVTLMDVKIGFN
ncbi:hypothetical protein [Methylomonas koyamae]|uniref:hypothetical protein n=1 Tax=Methylomonas koyamae TaxID=702114 RepID=UPI00112BB62D|nr:hypothetical protein [Methylomonas koyamae]TPQ27001.1 hypothetical protein C2U68_09970 [Methylomonas koyamae]